MCKVGEETTGVLVCFWYITNYISKEGIYMVVV